MTEEMSCLKRGLKLDHRNHWQLRREEWWLAQVIYQMNGYMFLKPTEKLPRQLLHSRRSQMSQKGREETVTKPKEDTKGISD